MVRLWACVLAIAGIAGCGNEEVGRIMFVQPSQMDAAQLQTLKSLPLTNGVTSLGVCGHMQQQRAKLTAKDLEIYRPILRARGLSNRDIEVIFDPKHIYGTGMSYTGLVCAIGRDMKVNKAFYQGIGHRWQAVTGEGYVYLEGDGTPEGMKITAWN